MKYCGVLTGLENILCILDELQYTYHFTIFKLVTLIFICLFIYTNSFYLN